jgi:DNA (cytosine-5)-methyltransferase 1
MGAGKSIERWDEWTEATKERLGNGNGHGASLSIEMLRLLPTVTTQDAKNNGGKSQFDRKTLPLNTQVKDTITWGKFEPAIKRWEQVLGRPAPAPTKPDGKDGAHRLSSKFTEWLMGLPDGWITDVGLTRNEELKACGNGVVPQQAELALRHLLAGLI